jgi:hypothetical protein
MKAFFVLATAALVAAQTQQPPALPDCAVTCITQSGCALTDPACLCAPDTIAKLTTCVVSGCGAAEAGSLAELATSACGPAAGGASASGDASAAGPTPTDDSTDDSDTAEPTEEATTSSKPAASKTSSAASEKTSNAAAGNAAAGFLALVAGVAAAL